MTYVLAYKWSNQIIHDMFIYKSLDVLIFPQWCVWRDGILQQAKQKLSYKVNKTELVEIFSSFITRPNFVSLLPEQNVYSSNLWLVKTKLILETDQLEVLFGA